MGFNEFLAFFETKLALPLLLLCFALWILRRSKKNSDIKTQSLREWRVDNGFEPTLFYDKQNSSDDWHGSGLGGDAAGAGAGGDWSDCESDAGDFSDDGCDD